MPELPEVQTIVDDLNKKVIGRKITGVWFDAPKLIKKPKAAELEKQIKGLKITGIKRRGKNILIYLDTDKRGLKTRINADKSGQMLLLVHQKMTGHLLYGKWSIKKVVGHKSSVTSQIKGIMDDMANGYIHVIFYLDNEWQIAFSDLRKFGKIIFDSKEKIENSPDIAELGLDPFDKQLTFEKFREIILSQKKAIKEVLMDQKLIAGIGNIYSDEILWMAKIHPLTPAKSLKVVQIKLIYASIKKVLTKALKLRGTSISDFRDAFGKLGFYADVRYVYRKEGKPCSRCKTSIKRIKMKSRSAHFCPFCQKI